MAPKNSETNAGASDSADGDIVRAQPQPLPVELSATPAPPPASPPADLQPRYEEPRGVPLPAMGGSRSAEELEALAVEQHQKRQKAEAGATAEAASKAE